MAKLTYANKVTLNPQTSIADINKVTADDMNEIKTVVNNNDDSTTANSTAITNLGNYSTTEVNTGKKWIDGKDIYRQVVPIDFPTTGTTKDVNHNISNINEVTDYYLKWYDTLDSRWFVNFKDTTGTYFIEINGVSTSKIYLKSGSSYDWQSRTSNRYAIIEYTKTS